MAEDEVVDSVKVLRDYGVMPAFKLWIPSGLTKWVTDKVGIDYMANVGGALHGHRWNFRAKAMRQSVDDNIGMEYQVGHKKMGIKKNESSTINRFSKKSRRRLPLLLETYHRKL